MRLRQIFIPATAALLLAACAGRQALAPTKTEPGPLKTFQAQDLGVKVEAASTGVQLLHSRVDESLYAVTCAGAKSLRLGLSAGVSVTSDDARVVFDRGAVSFPEGSQGFSLRVTNGQKTGELKVRCLPASFPRLHIDGRFSSSLALTTMPVEPPGGSFRVVLDASGFPVWFQEIEGAATDFTVEDDGSLFSFTTEARAVPAFSLKDGLGFELFDLTGRTLSSWVPKDFGLDFHAAALTPQGTLIGLRYFIADKGLPASMGKLDPANQMGTKCPSKTPTGTEKTIRGQLVEISTQGAVLQRWDMAEHLPNALRTAVWVNMNPFKGRADCVLEAEHLNGVQYLADSGQVLVTARHIDGAAMLDWSSGNVLWTLGGDQGPHSLRILDDPLGGPSLPHDANMLDSEHVLLFDNHPAKGSRALVYRIDEKARTATLELSIVPSCPGPCGAFAMGSARRSLDGSGFVLGLGTSPVTALEFATGSVEPRASLTLANHWTYRVLPVRELDPAQAWEAMNKRP